MDNKAQVSFEYFAVIAILMLLATIILAYSAMLFANKEGTKTAMALYKDELSNMLG